MGSAEKQCNFCLNVVHDGLATLIDDVIIKKLSIICYDLAITISGDTTICYRCLKMLNMFWEVRDKMYNRGRNECNKCDNSTDALLHITKAVSKYEVPSCILCWTHSGLEFSKCLVTDLFPDLDFLAAEVKVCQDCADLFKEMRDFKMKCLNTYRTICYRGIKIEEPQFGFFNNLELYNAALNLNQDFVANTKMKFDDTYTNSSSTVVDDEELCNFKIFLYETTEILIKPLKRNGISVFICPKCHYTVKDIRDHMKQHFNVVSRIGYGCNHCSFRCESPSIIKRHKCLTKVDTKPAVMFKCEMCPFSAKQKGNLKTHMLIHKPPKDIPMYKCTLCKFQSRQKGNLKTHLLVHQKPEQIDMYKCIHCSFQSRQKGNLQTHLLRKHKGCPENQLAEACMFRCKWCPFKAKKHSLIKAHIANHKLS